MTAREVKDVLRGRHAAVVEGMVGPWTTLEEWRNIDLLAVASWASVKPYPRYARVGYEVKVSRSDYKRELARGGKRASAVAFCHEFYFAVPLGLLKPEEMAWTPPWGFSEEFAPFEPMRCPGAYGAYCLDGRLRLGVVDRRRDADRRAGRLLPHLMNRDDYRHAYTGPCPTCRGAGSIADPPAVRAGAPPLWIPDDVGLVVVDGTGRSHIAKRAPRRDPSQRVGANGTLSSVLSSTRRETPGLFLTDKELADLVRWVSVRPDPRHAVLRSECLFEARDGQAFCIKHGLVHDSPAMVA